MQFFFDHFIWLAHLGFLQLSENTACSPLAIKCMACQCAWSLYIQICRELISSCIGKTKLNPFSDINRCIEYWAISCSANSTPETRFDKHSNVRWPNTFTHSHSHIPICNTFRLTCVWNIGTSFSPLVFIAFFALCRCSWFAVKFFLSFPSTPHTRLCNNVHGFVLDANRHWCTRCSVV